MTGYGPEMDGCACPSPIANLDGHIEGGLARVFDVAPGLSFQGDENGANLDSGGAMRRRSTAYHGSKMIGQL